MHKHLQSYGKIVISLQHEIEINWKTHFGLAGSSVHTGSK